ncbi:hypothetical protein HYW46_06030 [Candidatus Daviesbacteria bacterium]|nr:hypothetical protein [Candidatus Daviesbacteria bacterium]
MRSKSFGEIKNISKHFTKKESLEMFKKMCISRNFEFNTKDAFDKGYIKMPIYLSVGEESVSSAISIAYKKPHIFAQHRCHDIYLAFGGEIVPLIDELLHKPSGIAKGMGGSASIHSPKIGMFGHSGLMGDQIPIAVGYALGSKQKVLAIMGDASAEEDYVISSMGYAASKKLPVLFVCTDNGLSILTKVAVRRNWSMVNVAKAFGMDAVEITDDPWLIMHHVKKLAKNLPSFINIHTTRVLWHNGTGQDSEPEWDRFKIVKEDLKNLGLEKQALKIEQETKEFIDKLWKKQLKK